MSVSEMLVNYTMPLVNGSDTLLLAILAIAACGILFLIFLLIPKSPPAPQTKAIVPQADVKVVVLGQHKHSYTQPFTFDRVPVSGGCHTDYLIMVCPGCLTAVAFPRDNFLLATSEHQQWVKDGLRDIGITLLTD